MKREMEFLSSKLPLLKFSRWIPKIVEFFRTYRTYDEKDIKSQKKKKKWISCFNQAIKKDIDSFAITAS